MKAFPHFLIREVQKKDLNSLMALANTPGMFNFPSTPEGMKERIEISMRSFAGAEKNIAKTKYVFVAEEINTGNIVGTSMIAGQHGTESSPHYYFKVGTEKRFSQDLQTGFIHGTLFLKTQTDGPSELGALVVEEEHRNHVERVGRQIFFSRFLYLGMHPEKFRDQVLAELLPPLNKKGHSPLWEAIGRRFTNLDYWEADMLSAQNKNFIFDLCPAGKIYTSFLPAEARTAIGKVGKPTEPVLHLLKRIGFKYQNEIDPFDGGPHLRVKVSEIAPLKRLTKVVLKSLAEEVDPAELVSGLICPVGKKGAFRMVNVTGVLKKQEFHLGSEYELPKIYRLLDLKANEPVMFLPYF